MHKFNKIFENIDNNYSHLTVINHPELDFELHQISCYPAGVVIRLHKPVEIVGKLISLLTNTPLVHCSIASEFNCNKVIAEALPGSGISYTKGNPSLLSSVYDDVRKVYVLDHYNEFDMAGYVDSLPYKKYEAVPYELFKFLIPRSIKKLLGSVKIANKGYFCSEFVLDTLKFLKLIDKDIDTQGYLPDDLFNKLKPLDTVPYKELYMVYHNVNGLIRPKVYMPVKKNR